MVEGSSVRVFCINCGVPQGSVLGPLLFLIYVNDIYRVVPGENIKLFADDTNLFIFNEDSNKLTKRANNCLKDLDNWFKSNKLTLNLDKTSYNRPICYFLLEKYLALNCY